MLLNPPSPSPLLFHSNSSSFPPPPPAIHSSPTPPPPPMDYSDFPVSRSPRKELQGPRPPALKVRKDSHKIKKPPVAPNPNPNPTQIQNQNQQSQPRAPVIIYTVSPKVIHTNPDDFMTLVQRLTGPNASSAAAAAAAENPFGSDPGAMSPAARYATIEKARSPKEAGNRNQSQQMGGSASDFGDFFMEGVERSSGVGLPPGILSPGPGSLPPISPSFFCPPASNPDPGSVGFFHDLSPAGLHSSRGFLDGSGLLPSPTNFIAGFSPHTNSPFPSIDLFNNFNSGGNFDF